MATLFADGFDCSIVGLVEDFNAKIVRVCYSKSKMMNCLINAGMTYEEAIEYLDYNVWNSYVGEGTPIYLNDLVCVTRQDIEEYLEFE